MSELQQHDLFFLLEVACAFLFDVCFRSARGLLHIAKQRARNMQLLLRSFCFKLCSLLPIAQFSFDDGFRLRADSADDCGALEVMLRMQHFASDAYSRRLLRRSCREEYAVLGMSAGRRLPQRSCAVRVLRCMGFTFVCLC